MSKLIIQEHKSSSYAPRTYHNASVADITVAIALDFDTAGEKLTKKAAGDKYIHFDLRSDPLPCARVLYQRMKRDGCKTMNIAGNSIYTCQKYGWIQEKVNLWLLHLLSPIHEHIGIDHLYSGAQTGLDIAAGVCSVIMDIPCTMTLPKGYKMRFEDGKDIEQSQHDVYNYVMRMVEEIS
ncbi:hypothetical protein 2016DhaA_0715 [Vibrio phage ICP1]|jgi:hypothetical protein|nr:hypothetical protein [Vibrio phage JSF14]AXY82458.1 hypothetical protein ICP12011B_142 [Vibrio phage ICP1_2011_B]QVV99580.1 hypothetical protein 2016DhaA_0715 [Vibrio phage ICP1]HAS3707740.1 hypothetical protein [Vibrio cholerae]QVV99798.1 hypothetical protein 2017DhaA_0705 [Vibrio phage ICP1]